MAALNHSQNTRQLYMDCQQLLKMLKRRSYRSTLTLSIDFEHFFFKNNIQSNARERFSRAIDFLSRNKVILRQEDNLLTINYDAYNRYISSKLVE